MVKFVESSTKICKYDGGVCYFSSCSWLNDLGDAVLCIRHNGLGIVTPRRVGLQLRGVFDKHVLRRGS
jgi:hypothetical protein